MRTSSDRAAGGFTLVELIVVTAVMGIVLAGILLLFESGSGSARRMMGRRAAEEDATQASARLQSFVSTAGLWPARRTSAWHPVVSAEPSMLSFVSHPEGSGPLQAGDTLTIESSDEGIVARDGTGSVLYRSPPGVHALFSYMDCNEVEIPADDLALASGRDRVRLVRWRITSDSSEGLFELEGCCSPPNLMMR